jgi:CCR4-NOT transcription complex subunit 4
LIPTGGRIPSVRPGLGFVLPQSSPVQRHVSSTHTPTPAVIPQIPPKGPKAAMPELTAQKKSARVGAEARTSIKLLASESGLSKVIATQTKQKVALALPEEDFPALDSSRSMLPGVASLLTSASPPVSTPKTATSSGKKALPEPSPAPAVSAQGFRSADKRPVPGVLNIAAATKASETKIADTAVTSATERSDHASGFPALPTPTVASVSSPVTRSAPKTLRVVPTPKTEVPLSAVNIATTGSAARVVSYHRPDTPASEVISDSASIISASISVSRTSSPPPSKVGSASTRNATKSQQRKQRKEAQKEKAAIITDTSKQEPEEHAPILGRKKKQKKEKQAVNSGVVSSASRPDTPAGVAVREEDEVIKKVPEKLNQPEKQIIKGKGKGNSNKVVEGKGKAKEVATSLHLTTATEQPLSTVEEPLGTPTKLPPMPSSIFSDILASDRSINSDSLYSLKPVLGLNAKTEFGNANFSPSNAPKRGAQPSKSIVTEEDQAALLAGRPVRKIIDGSRVLITPNGDCIRNLTDEEEDRYLKLQASIASSSDNPAAFVATRHQASAGGFSLIKGRAVPNGPPSFFPQAVNAYVNDPVHKIQREEAISYINQYVLPKLNLGTTNLGFPGSWKSSSSQGVGKEGIPNTAAAAASLNSLAPWIYGPDVAAGAGIYGPGPNNSGTEIPEDETAFGGGLDTATKGDNSGAELNPSTAKSGIPLGNMPLMSVEEAETALALARKETEKLEKGLNQVIKRNRRLLFGGQHH